MFRIGARFHGWWLFASVLCLSAGIGVAQEPPPPQNPANINVSQRSEEDSRGAKPQEVDELEASESKIEPEAGVSPLPRNWLDPWVFRAQNLRPSPSLSQSVAAPRGPSTYTPDDPISYSGPDPRTVDDRSYRDGPQIPEPMVFDLVRGLGARKGELEFNILNLVPFRRRGERVYEWAPEIEWAIFDGFAIEYELPILDTQIIAQKFAAQYTFGTAFDDAFIHGVQGIAYFDTIDSHFIPTILYLAGVRLDKTWSLFGMFGTAVGPQAFPFVDNDTVSGTDLITNITIFANVTDNLILGVETNYSRQLSGPTEFLIIPQIHYSLGNHLKLQIGYGMRDDIKERFGELGYRIILER